MISISEENLKIVLDILKKYVPDREVRAFGSRYKWTAKEYSDLDIAVVGNGKLEDKLIYEIKESFEESNLPFRVDVLDWHGISAEFQKVIEEGFEVVWTGKGNDKAEINKDGWKQVKLTDVIDFNPKETLRKGEIAKKVAMEKLQPYYKYIRDYEIAAFSGGAKFRNGDTLLARITPCLENGKTAQVNILNAAEVGFGSTEFIVMREKEGYTTNDFIYYLSISPEFRNKAIQSMTGTSGRQRVQNDVLMNHIMELPSIAEQKAIASILSALDDKIELNNRINKTLEETAQAIFKSWFVDYEPFKDGEFEDSELGMIPKGYSVKHLYDFAEYINGTSFKKEEYSERGLPIIKIAELKEGIGATSRYFNGTKDKKFYLKDRDILFSWSGNPETSIDIFLWFKGDAILNQHIFKVVPNDVSEYAFVYLMLKYFKKEFTAIATNKQTTGLGHVTVSDLKRLKFVYNKDEITKFSKIVKPIIDNILNTYMSTVKLTNIRDSLLPKLMSGEIRVNLGGKS